MPTTDDVLELVSVALLQAWFPNGHQGVSNPDLEEDFENWVDCAIADATVAVRALLDAGLLSVSDSAKVDQETKDERS